MVRLKDFQYITLSFNQEHCIVEHLESIKYQILNHGSDYNNKFHLFDDFSTDDTIIKTIEWLECNPKLFYYYEININKENLGIKQNYLSSIAIIKSNSYSISAADDLYFINSIYDFIEFSNDKLLVFSPILSLVDNEFYRDFNFLKLVFLDIFFKKEIKKKLHKQNVFSAPGSHLNFSVLSQYSYVNYILSTSDNIYEDYPSWKFVYFVLNENASFYNSELVIYRHKYGKLKIDFAKKRKSEIFDLVKKNLVNLFFHVVSRIFFIKLQDKKTIIEFYKQLLYLGAKY